MEEFFATRKRHLDMARLCIIETVAEMPRNAAKMREHRKFLAPCEAIAEHGV